jgi:hypothetical protein
MSTFEILSQIDVNSMTEKKGKFTYLSWAAAWQVLMEKFPDATHDILEDVYYPDQTMEVRTSVTIDGHCLKCWLPVIDHNNKAIKNPNAFDVNKNRMRCLTKNLALHGLGIYIFRGEDIPSPPPVVATEEQKQELLSLLASKDGSGLIVFVKEAGTELMDQLFNSAPKGQKSRFKQEVRDLYQEGNESVKADLLAIQTALADGSADGLKEIMDELSTTELTLVEAAMTETEKHSIRTLRETL